MGRAAQSYRTDAQGVARIVHLPAARYRAAVTANDGRTGSTPFTVKDGEATKVAIGLR